MAGLHRLVPIVVAYVFFAGYYVSGLTAGAVKVIPAEEAHMARLSVTVSIRVA